MGEESYIKKIMELEPETAESCESCEVPVSGNCQSCGMPMISDGDYGGGDKENRYCVHCCHGDGSLKSYDEVLRSMVGLMMNNRSMDKAAAETAAADYMKTMPAWSGR